MRCHCDYVLLQYTLLVHVDISGGVGDSYVLAQHSFDVKMVMLSKMLINSLTHCLLHQSLHDLKKQGIYTKDLHGYYHLSTLIHMVCVRRHPPPVNRDFPQPATLPYIQNVSETIRRVLHAPSSASRSVIGHSVVHWSIWMTISYWNLKKELSTRFHVYRPCACVGVVRIFPRTYSLPFCREEE